MIRFERVAHAEQRAEARAGHEFEDWHDVSALILYPVASTGGGVHQ